MCVSAKAMENRSIKFGLALDKKRDKKKIILFVNFEIFRSD